MKTRKILITLYVNGVPMVDYKFNRPADAAKFIETFRQKGPFKDGQEVNIPIMLPIAPIPDKEKKQMSHLPTQDASKYKYTFKKRYIDE